jgi:hypothetical protein
VEATLPRDNMPHFSASQEISMNNLLSSTRRTGFAATPVVAIPNAVSRLLRIHAAIKGGLIGAAVVSAFAVGSAHMLESGTALVPVMGNSGMARFVGALPAFVVVRGEGAALQSADNGDAGEGTSLRSADSGDAGEGSALRSADNGDAGESSALRSADNGNAGEGSALRNADNGDAGEGASYLA